MHPISPVTDRQRAELRSVMHIHATPEAIFPLLCPVREYDWIPIWECDLVYTASGVAEEGCVFQTDRPHDGKKDTWVISRYEPDERISFIRFNELRTIRYDIRVEPLRDGSTKLHWLQEITALDAAGDAFVAEQSQDDFAQHIRIEERLLEHYLKTGEALSMDEAAA